jgi:hypothetical protein
MPFAIAMGGCRIRNQRFDQMFGTLGCVVRSRSDPSLRYILSAAHVMNPGGYGLRNDVIEAELDIGWTAIAVLEDWTALRDLSGVAQECDAAIARIIAPERVSSEIAGIGRPLDIARWAFADKRLRACGAASGRVVPSIVYEVGQQVPVLYEDWADAGVFSLPFTNAILYGAASGGPKVAMIPGDSGSLVLDDNRLAVGLHIARTDDAHPMRASVCTPIGTVLDTFNVDLETDAASSVASPAAVPRLVLDPEVLSEKGRSDFGMTVMRLLDPHTLFGGVSWQLTPEGLLVDKRLDRTGGKPLTVKRVWDGFGADIRDAAKEFKVPVELIVATICTESGGDPNVPSRSESGGRMSVGLMQTLIGTAQAVLPGETMNEATLKLPRTSIRAGTAYIARQGRQTNFDPPLVACAYNAGSLIENIGAANRWRMKQFPIGTGAHADRFVQWFNDCYALFTSLPDAAAALDGAPSFWRLFRA